jgi:hypothetical protein
MWRPYFRVPERPTKRCVLWRESSRNTTPVRQHLAGVPDKDRCPGDAIEMVSIEEVEAWIGVKMPV